jgi:hypothetical protein
MGNLHILGQHDTFLAPAGSGVYTHAPRREAHLHAELQQPDRPVARREAGFTVHGHEQAV